MVGFFNCVLVKSFIILTLLISLSQQFKLPEANLQNLKVILPESKQMIMVEQFQEALGAACMNDEDHLFALPRQSRCVIGLRVAYYYYFLDIMIGKLKGEIA